MLAAFLPWWSASHGPGEPEPHTHHSITLFDTEPFLVHSWATTITGALVAAAILLLVFRLMAKSWAYEPGKWDRDLWICFTLIALAILSVLWWPDQVQHFWGTHTFAPAPGSGGPTNLESTWPSIGWWLAIAAALLLLWASLQARRTRSMED